MHNQNLAKVAPNVSNSYLCNLKKLAKVNNHQMGEKSPNLVTQILSD
jgi:hypothetical protein